jgi:hypothetical protein
MQLSAFHPVPRQVSQSRRPNAQRAVPAGQSFVRFASGDSKKTPDKTDKPDEPKAERKSIGRTLFGSPLKNVGWSILYGAGGGVAFFMLPPAGLALLAVGALHGVVAIWQFIKQRKANPQQPEPSTSPAEVKGKTA